MSTLTITRQQLRAAIEAGITAAARSSRHFTADHAATLRLVGERATVVARGSFNVGDAQCPVAQAFTEHQRRRFDWTTGGGFCTAYDTLLYSICRWHGRYALSVTDPPEDRDGVMTTAPLLPRGCTITDHGTHVTARCACDFQTTWASMDFAAAALVNHARYDAWCHIHRNLTPVGADPVMGGEER